MIVVPDAGPLIYLGGAGKLDLLRLVFADVVVPRVVFEEVVLRGAGRPGAESVAEAAWLRIEESSPDPVLAGMLDPGEAAAIPLAARLGATILVDDAKARTVARARGLVVIGSLGVLLAAKRAGHIRAVVPTLARMQGLGMFVSLALWDEVLRLTAES